MLDLIKIRKGFPAVLPEQAFIRTLRLERKRTERSLQSFLLMLVDVKTGLGHPNESVVCRIVRGLSPVTRETDTCGWHRQDAVLAIIFSDVPIRTRELVKEAIESKIWSALRQQLRIDELEKIGISFEFFPETPNEQPPTSANQTLYPDLSRKGRMAGIPNVLKRVVDVFGSLTALVLLSPAFLLIAFLTKLTSRGPIFFRQTRVGQYGIPFTLFKFRSMRAGSDPEIHHEYIKHFIAGDTHSNCSESQASIYKLTSDPRIVPFGRLLRRTSLDELPQFWNVLRGEMSLVGPRPPTPYELELYQPWHRRRILEAKPGITGLWQVNGRSKMAFDEMVRLDLQYARTRSLWLDFKILLQTPRAVLIGEGAY